jgi:hypothetical protein
MRSLSIRSALVLGFLTSVAFCQTAAAQFYPGAYGGWGGYPSASAPAGAWSYSNQRTESQQIGAARTQAAANMTRGAMLSDAQARSAAAAGQRQSNRDWWFQTQQQQMEQQRAAAMSRGTSGPMPTFEPAAYTAARPTAQSTSDDVIRWPAVLREEPFAAGRALVEAPYRRKPMTNPTATDYENMLKAVGEMKAALKQMTAQISAQEYLDADAFLNQLAGEAQKRLEQMATPALEKTAPAAKAAATEKAAEKAAAPK